MMASHSSDSGILDVSDTDGSISFSTVNMIFSLMLFNVYVIVCSPSPAKDALNVDPVTPFPDQLPPAGVADSEIVDSKHTF